LDRPEPARVLECREAARSIALLRMENVLEKDPQPGQFIMVWNGGNEKPMGIARIQDGELHIMVKHVGPFTEALCNAKPGTLIGLRGPYGRPFDLSFEKPILVGGGIGASPLLFLASSLAAKGTDVRIVAGFNKAADAINVDEFRNLGETSVCTMDGSLGGAGTVSENLPKLGDHGCVYTCGPEPMMLAVAKQAEKEGIKCQLLVERYFKCGIGLCGSCCLGRLVVCRDGPVLFWKELKETEFGAFERDACGLRQPLV
jgi:dihydroorotate dehydrogenase electron transfer subunit